MIPKPSRIRKTNFHGWDAIMLNNGLTSLVAVPIIGGRVMAYDLQTYSYLFVDRNLAGKLFTPEEHMGDGSIPNWKNYGGDKTWPSPQGWSGPDEWPGPPDAILDSGHYTLSDQQENPDGTAEIEMTSPPDRERTGIQIIRRFKLHPGSSRITQTLTFKNVSDRKVRWSIWDVNQLLAERVLPDGSLDVEKECVITTRLNPNSKFPRGYNVMFGDENNPQWQADSQSGLFYGRYLWEIGKVGIDTTCGWIGFSNTARGYAMCEQFPYFPGQEYPDSGVTVECWTVGRGEVAGLNYEGSGIYLMEIEVLSPFYWFEPGQSHTFVVEWGACRLKGAITHAEEGGVTSGTPHIEMGKNGKLRLCGQFGVFDEGELVLSGRTGTQETLVEYNLGPVSPLQVLDLDETVNLPEGVRNLVLEVSASVDGSRRLLYSFAGR